MSEKLILVTRIDLSYGDEWKQHWNDESNITEEKSFLCFGEKGGKEYKTKEEIMGMETIDYSFIVIAGNRFKDKCEIFSLLYKILLKTDKDYIIGIHYGGGGTGHKNIYSDIDKCEELESNEKEKIKGKIHPYTITDISSFAEYCKNVKGSDFQLNLNVTIKKYKKENSNNINEESRKEFSILKHKIMNLFLDLDIDYQGINESNNKVTYFKDIENKKIKNKLSELKTIFKESTFSLEEKLKIKKENIEEQELLKILEDTDLYNALDGNRGLLAFNEKLYSFHDWYCDLEYCLNKIWENT